MDFIVSCDPSVSSLSCIGGFQVPFSVSTCLVDWTYLYVWLHGLHGLNAIYGTFGIPETYSIEKESLIFHMFLILEE